MPNPAIGRNLVRTHGRRMVNASWLRQETEPIRDTSMKIVFAVARVLGVCVLSDEGNRRCNTTLDENDSESINNVKKADQHATPVKGVVLEVCSKLKGVAMTERI